MIEVARADAEAYLAIARKTANPESFLRLITTKHLFDAMRGDTHHAGIFLFLALVRDGDTSVSHAISTAAHIDPFNFPELNDFYLSLRRAVAVGPDGSAEQACAWSAAMEDAPEYLRSITPSLADIRTAGQQIYFKSSDWRSDAFALKSGISPQKANFPQCGLPQP